MAKITIPKSDCLKDEAIPDLCMCCGQNASKPEHTVNYTATYSSPIAILGFFLFSLPGLLIMYFLTRKTHPVLIKQCGTCAPIRARLGMLLGLNWFVCLALLFGGVGVVNMETPSNGLGPVGGFMTMLAFIYPLLYWGFYSRRYNISCVGIDKDTVSMNLPNKAYGLNCASYIRPMKSQQVQLTCQNCRSLIPSDANFCSSCGQTI